jgi:hypothetical protein
MQNSDYVGNRNHLRHVSKKSILTLGNKVENWEVTSELTGLLQNPLRKEINQRH